VSRLNIVAAAIILFSLGSVCQAAPKVIKVKNATQLVQALGSHRVIELEAGDYDLKEAWTALKKKGGKVRMDKVHDGKELVLTKVVGLTLKGVGKTRSRIITPSAYATVLTLKNCDKIVLENLELGHWPNPGSCIGRVMGVFRSRDVQIKNCDLFGSGTIGVDIDRSSRIEVSGSIVRDCSSWLVRAFYSKQLTFDKIEFKENQKRDADRAFHFHEAYQARFVGSSLTTISPQSKTIEKIIGKGLPADYVAVEDCKLVLSK
jgi:hypothetical protein